MDECCISGVCDYHMARNEAALRAFDDGAAAALKSLADSFDAADMAEAARITRRCLARVMDGATDD